MSDIPNAEIEFKLRLAGLPIYQLRRMATLAYKHSPGGACPICREDISKRKFYQHCKKHAFVALLEYVRRHEAVLIRLVKPPHAKQKFSIGHVLERLKTV